MRPFQVTGGPRWITEDLYNVAGKPPAGSKASQSNPSNRKLPPNDEQRQMLQTLLIERFHLKFHLESKEGPVYYLTRGTKELKLATPKNKDEYPWAGAVGNGVPFGDGILGENISMAWLALTAEQPDDTAAIFRSIQELGLKLESAKGPISYLVIDSAEKPSAN